MSKGSRRRRSSRARASTRPLKAADAAPRGAGEGPLSLATLLDRAWDASRGGAIAGRGYHYQDAVGAWVALAMLSGAVEADMLVPEGLEDLVFEGTAARHLQVKSRQARVGDFGASEAARHVVDTWLRRRDRDGVEPVVVVLERAVEGYAPRDWTATLAADTGWAKVAGAARARADTCGIAATEAEALLGQTAIVVLPHRALAVESAELVAARTGLPVGAAVPVVQALRAAVADCADRNAEVGWESRAGLTRTDLERLVVEAAALVDAESLQEAVATGACEPVDFDSALEDPAFYAGTGVQPGHVAAGLVVARPDATDAVLAGLDAGKAVLVAGPSGVGKSAVMWMAVYVARHVVWYRVHRLRPRDVEPLVRLARAAGAGRYGPVGLVVDGVGVGAMTAWDELHRRAAAVPGLLLVGSVREEDVLPLEAYADCVLVRPRLDEALAARIHAALLDRGATGQPHWREAFDATDGLTLEFTHLLTQGRRLRDVVAEQVRARVRERRVVELAILAPVSVSDQWGAALTSYAVGELVKACTGELKAALSRLVKEHVLAVDCGIVRGVHPLRSAALCEAVHEVPPPTLADTVTDVLRQIPADQLGGFVARTLAQRPDLGEPVVRALADRISAAASDGASLAAAALSGLRLADFTATARQWAAILDRHGVAAPLRPLALDLAMLDTDLLDEFDPRLRAAVEEIRAGRDDATSTMRDALVKLVGPSRLAGLAAEAASVEAATALLAPLAGTGLNLAPPRSRGWALEIALQTAPLDGLAELLTAAAAVSAGTGAALVEFVGGTDAITARILDHHLWLLDLAVVDEGGERVLRGRVLHAADRHTPDPDAYVRELARLALQCVPEADRADLVTVVAGGAPLRVGDLDVGRSGLLREYVHGAAEVQWNRTRARYARSLVAAPTATLRLSSGEEILQRVADFLADLTDGWSRGTVTGARLTQMNRRRDMLAAEIDAFAPRRPAAPVGGSDDEPGGMLDNDPIHGLAQGIVLNLARRITDPSGYRSLAAFAADTLRPQVATAAAEPWILLGRDSPPSALGRLDSLLRDLAAVLAELAFGSTTGREFAAVGAAAPRGTRLARLATLAADRAVRRYERKLAALADAAAARGLAVDVKSQEDDTAKAVEWPARRTAVVVDLASLTALDDAHRVIAELITEAGLPDNMAVVIPTRAGSPLPRYTATVFSSGAVYPFADVAVPWLPFLPTSRATPLTDAVADALAALQELSALAYLDHERDTDAAAQAAAEDAARRFGEAIDAVRLLPADDVTHQILLTLGELAERVQDELDGTWTDRPLAGQAAAGLAEPTEEFRTITGLMVVASEWDVDPHDAAALLDAT